MEQIKKIITGFEPISLAEMDSVKLMDRVDSKYIFHLDKLLGILSGMKSTYRLLEINNVRLHNYESLYYDTDDFRLFTHHNIGKLNRHKVRFRRYTDSGGLTFFEIKFKNNKGRTIKKRVQHHEIGDVIIGKPEELLKEITPYSSDMFSPKLWVNYCRMTFINMLCAERLTIDINLHFIGASGNGSGEKKMVYYPQLVVAESKRDKTSTISQFIRLVRQNQIREGAISKYCFGIVSIYGDLVRKNNLKERVRYIHKTINKKSFALT